MITDSKKKETSKHQVIQRFSHGRSHVVTVQKKRKRPQTLLNKNKNHTQETETAEIAARKRALAAARQNTNTPPPPYSKWPSPSMPPARAPKEQTSQASKASQVPSATPVPEVTKAPQRRPQTNTHNLRRRTSEDEQEFGGKPNKRAVVKRLEERDEKHPNRFYGLSEEADGTTAYSPKVRKRHTPKEPREKISHSVTLPPQIAIRDLADLVAEKVPTLLRTGMNQGLQVSINSTLDAETAELIVTELGHTAKAAQTPDERLEKLILSLQESYSNAGLVERPPVVTVMGHVDHGKTSLLDTIRRTNITKKEAGGITQHIGAYQIRPSNKKKSITFIDTPGHAAFTAMRARGASVTDIVILLVAADDGIKAQTVEAIQHAKASGAPIVVVINKIDKPEAKPDQVRNELLQHQLITEKLGGDIQDVELSAKTGEGIDKLLEALLLQAEMLELKAASKGFAKGTILEGRLDRKKGAIGTVLVQNGVLQRGDIFVTGGHTGRVRLMNDDQGRTIQKAHAATPVEVMGFSAPPMAGDTFFVTPSENTAEEIAALAAEKRAETAIQPTPSIHDLLAMNTGEVKELPLILRADTQGSLEALHQALAKIEHPEVTLKIIYKSIGMPTESDIHLAQTAGAIITAFGVRIPPAFFENAKKAGVTVQSQDIIYKMIEEITALLEGLLSPEKVENAIGQATIRQIFDVKRLGQIAGCHINSGLIKRGALVRVKRNTEILMETFINTLKREKNDVREVKEGYECGITLDATQKLEVGDVIEAYEIKNVKRTLDNGKSS